MRYFFSTLNIYIARLFLKWFAIVFVGFASIFSLLESMDLFRKLLSRPDASVLIVVEMLILKLPYVLSWLLPFLILSSVMMTIFRLNQGSELTIIKSSGVSIFQVIGGLVGVVFVLGLLMITILNPIQATMTARLHDLEDKFFGLQHEQVSFQETGLWLKEKIHGQDRIIHVLNTDMRTLKFDTVSFYDFDKNGHYTRRVMAKSATLQDGVFTLNDGQIYAKKGGIKSFSVLALHTRVTPEKIRDHNATPETMNVLQIMKHIDVLEASELSSLTYRMHVYKEFSKIGLMVVMVFLATAFCLRPPRRGGGGSLLGLCLITGLLFHFLSDFVYALGLGGRLPPLIAVGSPVVIGGMISFAMLLFAEDSKG